jgi:hypothetical protein
MSLKKLLLPAAVLIAVMSFLASHAQAQTMGEYATTTAGVGTGGGSMGTSFSPPSFGGSSQTWGVSGTGGSWADRAGAASASMSSSSASGSRWPETGLSSRQGSSFGESKLGNMPDRFSNAGSSWNSSQDRWPSRTSSSDSRWPSTSLSDNKGGLDTSYNSVNGN